MKILLVSQNYYPYVGGIETHVRQIAQELSARHEVKIAAVNFTQNHLPPRLAVLRTNLLATPYRGYREGHVSIHSLAPSQADRVRLLPMAAAALPGAGRLPYDRFKELNYRLYRPVFGAKLGRLVAGVDLVHSLAGDYLGWAAQAAARAAGVPFVCTPFVHPGQWGDDRPNRDFYRRCEAVIALLESDRVYLESLGVDPARLHVIGVSPDLPPTTDPDGFRRRHGLEGVPLVLYVGRMMPQKGAKAVLEATGAVWQSVPEAHFVFIGPAHAQAENWFAGADPRIHFLGKVSAQEKADALAACDLFCMPSRSEILPTVYLEAWSLGKAVVGGDAPGLSALIAGNEAGLSVGQAPAQVAAALVELLQNSARRALFGQHGRRLVEQNYTVAAVTEALEKLYNELEAAHRQPKPW